MATISGTKLLVLCFKCERCAKPFTVILENIFYLLHTYFSLQCHSAVSIRVLNERNHGDRGK